MIRITMSGLIGISFAEQKYLRDSERRLTKLVKEAAREWLIAVLTAIDGAPYTVGDSFPVQTGEAKGSLLPVATLLNRSGVGIDVPIGVAPGRENRISQGRGQGHVTIGPEGGRFNFQFEFRTDVLHFAWNEDNPAPEKLNIQSSTPWYSFVAGSVAFFNFINEHIEDAVPNINNYVITQSD